MKLKKTGFSIAELLITMLVVMLVAAAIVPMIGPKKLKVPFPKTEHGIAQCYYGDDGKVHYFTQNNKSNKTGHDEPMSGDYCEIKNLPQANSFTIYSIGPGGEAMTEEEAKNNMSLTTPVAEEHSGNINLDANFQSDISAADKKVAGLSDRIRNAINAMAWGEYNNGALAKYMYARFFIHSPVARGGKGHCRAVYYAPTDTANKKCKELGAETTIINNPLVLPYGENYYPVHQYGIGEKPNQLEYNDYGDEAYCYYFTKGSGSNSGSGMYSIVNFPIDGNSNITVESGADKAGVRVLGTTMKKNGVPYGTNNALYLSSSEPGLDAGSSTFNNYDATKGEFQSSGMSNVYSLPAEITVKEGYFLDNGIFKKIEEKATYQNDLNKKTANSVIQSNNSSKAFVYGFLGYSNMGAQEGIAKRNATDTRYTGECEQKMGDPAIYGFVESLDHNFGSGGAKNYIDWSYKRQKAALDYVKAATHGQEQIFVYEKLKGPIYVFPGKNGRDTKITSDKQGNNNIVQEAKRGNKASKDSVDLDLKGGDLPVPNIVKTNSQAKNNFSYLSYIKKQNPLQDCTNNGNCPGFAPDSPYPFLKSFSVVNEFHMLNGSYKEDESLPQNANENAKCDNGEEPIKLENSTGDADLYYCKATKTNVGKGAVFIVW